MFGKHFHHIKTAALVGVWILIFCTFKGLLKTEKLILEKKRPFKCCRSRFGQLQNDGEKIRKNKIRLVIFDNIRKMSIFLDFQGEGNYKKLLNPNFPVHNLIALLQRCSAWTCYAYLLFYKPRSKLSSFSCFSAFSFVTSLESDHNFLRISSKNSTHTWDYEKWKSLKIWPNYDHFKKSQNPL